MAHIVVAGSVNLDRVWWLEAPLQSGARLSYAHRQLRLGGGGFNTAVALRTLGHDVSIVASLADDKAGRACRRALERLGFRLSHISFSRSHTVPLEILVDPGGERTILAPASAEHGRVTEIPPLAADAVYVNLRRMAPAALAGVPAATLLISQVPLEPGEHRPADILIGAVSDGKLAARSDAFSEAREIAGPRLRALVLTDGAEPMHVVEADSQTRVDVTPNPNPKDTTGAGDVFAAGYVDACIRGYAPVQAARHADGIAAAFLVDRDGFGFDGSVCSELEESLGT